MQIAKVKTERANIRVRGDAKASHSSRRRALQLAEHTESCAQLVA